MKNKFIAILLIGSIVFVFAACASQKYGCPATAQYHSKFRG
ncbi:MAG: hypothetical protein R2796_05110 [Chitinophagaceae bacterium]